jgi:hypothetical protein
VGKFKLLRIAFLFACSLFISSNSSAFTVKNVGSLRINNYCPEITACFTIHSLEGCACNVSDEDHQCCCHCAGCKCPAATEVEKVVHEGNRPRIINFKGKKNTLIELLDQQGRKLEFETIRREEDGDTATVTIWGNPREGYSVSIYITTRES